MTTTNPIEDLLTVGDVAAKLKVSIRTVRRLIKKGMLPYIRIGASQRIRPDDLKSYIAMNRVG